MYDDAMTRVGIVAKSHLRAATPHLTAIESWLVQRGHEAIFETATAALMPPAEGRQVADKSTLVADVGLLVVLGGDGTLLSVADCAGGPMWTCRFSVSTSAALDFSRKQHSRSC